MESCFNYESDENSKIERKEYFTIWFGSTSWSPLLDHDKWSGYIYCSLALLSELGWKLAQMPNTCIADEKCYSSDDDSDMTTELQGIEKIVLMNNSASLVHTRRSKYM